MINAELLIKRLEIVIQFHSLSASQFADRIGVQPSSISHLLTGRNKPSLEFVMKLVKEFPDVNLYWLLYGQGDFPELKKENAYPSSKEKTIKKEVDPSLPSEGKLIKKVIILYRDGSFEAYESDRIQ